MVMSIVRPHEVKVLNAIKRSLEMQFRLKERALISMVGVDVYRDIVPLSAPSVVPVSHHLVAIRAAHQKIKILDLEGYHPYPLLQAPASYLYR